MLEGAFGCRAGLPRVNPDALCRASPGLLPIRPPTAVFGMLMHRYRSHTCGALRKSDIGQTVRLSGWCHRIRDHGGVLFIDLRDHYGLTQCVVVPYSPAFKAADRPLSVWVVLVDGKSCRRPHCTTDSELSSCD